eukprot:12986726-Ditylum_brightwellii.AAC.1
MARNCHDGSLVLLNLSILDVLTTAALPNFNLPKWIEMFGKTDLQYFGDDELKSNATNALSDSIVDARQQESTTNSILEQLLVPCIDDSPSLSKGGIFVSKKNKDPDILSYHEAMHHPDQEKWIKSAIKEINELEDHDVWEEVPIASVKDAKIVPCTWVFHIKCAPDGTIKKYKGIICLCGNLMESVCDVFAPVVAYPTICCFLHLALFLGWDTISPIHFVKVTTCTRPTCKFLWLRDKGFQLTLEGSFTEFLGIQYHKDLAGNIHLTQDGLIKKILETTGHTDCKPNKVPCCCEPLGIDENGESFDEPWSYPFVAGMLLYLSTNTRIDIAFAVSQICRFTHKPKKSHGIAIKIICRYLKGTIGKGTIIKPSNKLCLHFYL